MIIVDTNLIAYLLINGEHSEAAERVFETDPEWIAPLLWRSEFRSVLLKCLRKELFGLDDALRIMAAAEDLLAEREYAVVSADALSLAAAAGCSAYDAEFVSLAYALRCHFITLDRHLLEQFPETAVAPYLWILSRSAHMEDALYADLKARAAAKGFDVARLVKTLQPPE